MNTSAIESPYARSSVCRAIFLMRTRDVTLVSLGVGVVAAVRLFERYTAPEVVQPLIEQPELAVTVAPEQNAVTNERIGLSSPLLKSPVAPSLDGGKDEKDYMLFICKFFSSLGVSINIIPLCRIGPATESGRLGRGTACPGRSELRVAMRPHPRQTRLVDESRPRRSAL